MSPCSVVVRHEEPDLIIRSIPDNASFQVKRTCLARSQVFQDMFACCEPEQRCEDGCSADDSQVLDTPESASTLRLLIDLLQSPPQAVAPAAKPKALHLSSLLERQPADADVTKNQKEEKIIPLPLLPRLLALADKYMLSPEIAEALHTHMLAQAPANPLRVYGLASLLELPHIACAASKYLLGPPLDTYSAEQIRENIPDVEAYHLLVRLQALRGRRLKEVLAGEVLFPHGYGRCDAHDQSAVLCWEKRKQRVGWKIHAGTDVAYEMREVLLSFEGCVTCSKAGQAALDMLQYKCNKCPKRIDQLSP